MVHYHLQLKWLSAESRMGIIECLKPFLKNDNCPKQANRMQWTWITVTAVMKIYMRYVYIYIYIYIYRYTYECAIYKYVLHMEWRVIWTVRYTHHSQDYLMSCVCGVDYITICNNFTLSAATICKLTALQWASLPHYRTITCLRANADFLNPDHRICIHWNRYDICKTIRHQPTSLTLF